MAVNKGTATLLTSHTAKTNGKQRANLNKSDTRLSSQLTHKAPVATAKILSRSNPTSGTLTYTLQIGTIKIPDVSAFEIFDYVSPYDLEVFENASFKAEIAALEAAAKKRSQEAPTSCGPGRPPKRDVKTSESEDVDDSRGEDDDTSAPTSMLGGRRPRPTYTHFYPKQRAKRGGTREHDDSVQVVVGSRNQGGFVRPDIPASYAASPASSGLERQPKRQKRDPRSSSREESVYSIASLPVQQSNLVNAAGRVTSKVPESQSPKDVEMTEASSAVESHSRSGTSESPIDVDEASRVATSEQSRKSRIKAALMSNNPSVNRNASKVKAKASGTPFSTSIPKVGVSEPRSASAKAKAVASEMLAASLGSRAHSSGTSSASTSGIRTQTPKASAIPNSTSKSTNIPASTRKVVEKPSVPKADDKRRILRSSSTPNPPSSKAAFTSNTQSKTKASSSQPHPPKKPSRPSAKSSIPQKDGAASPKPSTASSPASSSSESSSSSDSGSEDSEDSDEEDSDEEEKEGKKIYRVEKVLAHGLSDPLTHRDHGGLPIMLFQVKWVGYEEMTWEPESSFEDKGILTDYWRTAQGK